MFLAEGLQPVYIVTEFSECYASIDLCRGDVGVSHHAAYALDGQSCIEAHYSEAVACTVEGDAARDAAKEAPVKVFENGQIIINGKYNAAGAVVK